MTEPSARAHLDEQPDGWLDAARGLADATRELVDAVGLTAVDAAAVEAARDEVERVTAALRERARPHPLRTRLPGGSEEVAGVTEFVTRPTSAFHPVLPMRFNGERLTATWTASAAHEGPPDHLHGGVSAWHLDALLGSLANLVAGPAVTATLEVRYRRPVPVGVPLELAATPERVSERRTVVAGTIAAGGETCVEGRGVFVRLDRSAGQR